MNASGFSNVLQDALSRQTEAETNLGFLFPVEGVSSLITNSDFIASLHCSVESLEFVNPVNISCMEACGNTDTIFSNWSNFYTCSWYPTLSQALNGPNVSDSIVQSFSKVGILANQSNISQAISSSISTCLSDYCDSSNDCRKLDSHTKSCSLDNLIISSGTSTTINRTRAITCLRDNVCSSTGEVNPDIGGLGVILSLLVQYSLSLLGLLSHLLFYIWYQVHRKILARTVKIETQGEKLSMAKQNLTQHLEALTSALVEFQKAQCFFSATLQIAAIIVLPQYEIGERSKDQILLRLTAANAFAPIILTLAHIDLIGGRNSKYLLSLSFVSFCLGSSSYWLSYPVQGGGHTFFEYVPPKIPVMSCKNIAPFAPCYLHNQFFLFSFWSGDSGIFYSQPQKIGLAVWLVTLAILLYRILFTFCTAGYSPGPSLQLLLDQWSQFQERVLHMVLALRYIQQVLQFFEAIPCTPVVLAWGRGLLVFLGKRRTWVYVQITLAAMAVIMQLVSVIQVLQFSSNIISTQMSFGQIVAVGIWVPVLLEYGYLEITGAAEGTEYRLKLPLVVTEGSPQAETSTPKMTPAIGEADSLDRFQQSGI